MKHLDQSSPVIPISNLGLQKDCEGEYLHRMVWLLRTFEKRCNNKIYVCVFKCMQTCRL